MSQRTPQYSLTREELAQRLLNPSPGKDSFRPITDEYIKDDDGEYTNNIDTTAYTERFLTENPKYKSLLAENKPVEEPGYWDITKQALSSIVGMSESAILNTANYITTEITDLKDESLPYMSQEEYQKRKAEGETPDKIWPWLMDSKYRTGTDYAVNRQRASNIYGEAFMKYAEGKGDEKPEQYLERFDKDNPLKPNSPEYFQAYKQREQWYNAGGEINERGEWQDKDGNVHTGSAISNQ